jgi:NitT/TauT family transport system ATP-binding protein
MSERSSLHGQSVPVSVRHVSKAFRGATTEAEVIALDDVSLDIAPHSFVSFLGPSGCGKTTLLRIIAGIEKPSAGEIICNGERLSSVNTSVAYVPQGKGLFPWLTLRQNVEFPLRLRKYPSSVVGEKVRGWIDKVGLSGFEDLYPWQLSGGMEKRGSLARALVADLGIVLMDEPFGPLDAQTRLVLQNDLLRLWAEQRSVIVFVTHDLVEAVALSDVIIVMSRRPGRIKTIIQVPIPRPRDVFEIYKAPGFDAVYEQVRETMHDELIATP